MGNDRTLSDWLKDPTQSAKGLVKETIRKGVDWVLEKFVQAILKIRGVTPPDATASVSTPPTPADGSANAPATAPAAPEAAQQQGNAAASASTTANPAPTTPPPASDNSLLGQIWADTKDAAHRALGDGTRAPQSTTDTSQQTGDTPSSPSSSSPSLAGRLWNGAKKWLGKLLGGSSDEESEGGGLLGGLLGGAVKAIALLAVVGMVSAINPLLGLLVGVAAIASGVFSEGGGLLGDVMSTMFSFGKSLLNIQDDHTAPARTGQETRQGLSKAWNEATHGEIFSSIGTAASTGLNTAKGLTREIEAVHYLEGKGWTREQAIGIIANLHGEGNSTFLGGDVLDPAIGGDPDKKTGKNQAYGIAQWWPSRVKALEDAGFKIKGGTLTDQLDALDYELRHRPEGAAVARSTSREEVARIMTIRFERPKDMEERAKERAAYSNALAAKMQDTGTRVASITPPMDTPRVTSNQSVAPTATG